MQICIIYSRKSMLQCDDTSSFPSLLLIFSVVRLSDLGNCVHLCTPQQFFLIPRAPFYTMPLVYFIQLTSTLPHQRTQWVRVQITAASVGTNQSPIQLLSAGLGFSRGSCGRAGSRPIETRLVVQAGLPQGGVKHRTRLWKFTDSLSVP